MWHASECDILFQSMFFFWWTTLSPHMHIFLSSTRLSWNLKAMIQVKLPHYRTQTQVPLSATSHKCPFLNRPLQILSPSMQKKISIEIGNG